MDVVLVVEAGPGEPELELRAWRDADAAALAAEHRDPEMRLRLARWVDGEDDARSWLADQAKGWATGERFAFAVVERGDGGRLIGHVAVKRAERAGAAEIGYWTGAAARGRGIAPRVVRTVTDWVFAPGFPWPVSHIELMHAVANPASCRVATKCGYELRSELAPFPPMFPHRGHLHVRNAPEANAPDATPSEATPPGA
ncbi:GNAT family N-acetyltransferase [Streptomyces sp. CA-111067]|uniref:GNAT family N-acetyltransferase n=1 Tax=Streptomyces sp. CA-111067 TaxID=3240046 RepID=UPI003D95B896